jgi:iron complex outermembrane recepter protein
MGNRERSRANAVPALARCLVFVLPLAIFAAGMAENTAFAQPEQPNLPVIVVEATPRPAAKRTRSARGAPAQVFRARPSSTRPDPSAPTVRLPDGVVLNGGPPLVMTTAGPVSGYRALTGVTATKTDTPIERIPQSIAVVPRSLIDDQKPLTQSEALRNVSATIGLPSNIPRGFNYRVRGFDAERYVDGLPNFQDIGDYTSLVNTERIEVVKGPGLFFQSGVGIVGGVINTVAKLPTAVPAYQAGLTAGGFSLWNPWFDINRPLNQSGAALFRMSGEYERTRDYVDVIERQRYSLNPTLTFTDNDTTSLTLQGRLSRRDDQVYVGLPATGTLDRSLFTLRHDLFVGPPDVPKGLSESNGMTARFDRTLNDVWSLDVIARYGETRLRTPSQFYLFNRPDFGTVFAMSNVSTPQDTKELSVSPTLTARLDIGESRNTLLLGADYNRVAENATTWAAFAGLTDFAVPNPVFPRYTDPVGSGQVVARADNVNVNGGVVAQWQSTVWSRLHLLAGARLGLVDIVGSHPVQTQAAVHTEEAKVLPRAGVAYDLLPGVTLFGGYGEGLRAVRLLAGAAPPKPEEAAQLEAGVKLVLPFGFSGTLAAFDITRRNVVSSDPRNPLLQIQTGEQRSRGFDADLTWQPIPGLQMIASYAHVEAEITKDELVPVGNRVDRVPQDSGRLWTHYKFQDGWLRNVSVGAGFYAASRQAISLDNQFFTPGFVTLDAKIGYDSDRWSIALTGKNLTNRPYFIPYPFATGRVAPSEPLTVFAAAMIRH